ncbi:MAG: TIGR01212 family radical SAM protein [Clostridia bacterium]|nr:TIGR01212 family radical SAM protein [Clostridia bacterium]
MKEHEQENPFPYSHTNKRYHTYDHYVKSVFGEKCVKVGLDGGFTCPNRDGSKGVGGCAFCAAGGGESLPLGRDEGLPRPLRAQYEEGRARLMNKWGNAPVSAYFQNYTSTYAPVERLRALYEEALSFEDVVGLTIGTRPDCLPHDVLSYLEELNSRTRLTVELGLQTTFDESAQALNRHHSYDDFLKAFHALRAKGISVGVHLLNGLPGESREMMLENARRVGALHPQFVKIHCLYYRKGSALTERFLRGELTAMSMEDYVELLADQIEVLPPETVVERVTGDAKRGSLVAPLWSTNKIKVINLLDQTLAKRGSFQGKKLEFVQVAQK